MERRYDDEEEGEEDYFGEDDGYDYKYKKYSLDLTLIERRRNTIMITSLRLLLLGNVHANVSRGSRRIALK